VEKRAVNPWTWQEQFGFEQAIETTGAERALFCAGQTSVDPNGAPLHEGDMKAQVEQALENVETVLREAGFEPSDVTRLNVYTTDVDAFIQSSADITRLNDAGARFSSTLLGVSRLAFPELMVELEATAIK
jgi:enamine deaminase RidA (YjgF/YER057c/UK114 family)